MKNKINKAIALLKEHEPDDGYFLAFSGGKDSLVIYHLAKLSGVKFDAHYSFTTVDPPELVQYVQTFDDVEIIYPSINMWDLIEKKLMPPTRLVRYCCDYLKEDKGAERTVIVGVRASESKARAKQEQVEIYKKKKIVKPIFHWTDEDVWEFIRGHNLEYCKLYDEGFDRIGCVGCPLAGKKKMEAEFERYPLYKQAYIKAFDRMIANRHKRGKVTQWRNGEEVFEWWISGGKKKFNKDQVTIEDIINNT